MNFPYFSAGNTPLTAAQLNTLIDQLQRTSNITVTPPLAVLQTPDGWAIRLVGGTGFWAEVGDQAGGQYDWKEATLLPSGAFAPVSSGRFGVQGSRPAVEVNGDTGVPPGTHVWLIQTSTRSGEAYRFAAPISIGPFRTAVLARIGVEEAGRYDWNQVFLDTDGEFRDLPGGLIGVATDQTGATEATLLSGVPVDAIVIIYDATPGEPDPTYSFVYAGGGTGFWGRVTRDSLNSTWVVSLGSGTGGTWKLTLIDTDGPTDSVPGGQTGEIPAISSMETVQTALEAVAGVGNVTVSGSEGSYTIEMVGRLAAGHKASWLLDDTSLSVATDSTTTPNITQTVVGRDVPFTDGAARYNWTTVTFDEAGNANANANATRCHWPFNRAREMNRLTQIPEGALVWLRPGFLLRRKKDEIEDDDFFTPFSDDEKATYLSTYGQLLSADDLGSFDGYSPDVTDWYVDLEYEFFWPGDGAFWGKVIAEVDGKPGRYTVRRLHLPGLPPPDAGQAPAQFVGTSWLLDGSHRTPLVSSTWSESLYGKDPMDVVATENQKLSQVPVGSVVRVWPKSRTEASTAPSYGFDALDWGRWASVKSFDGSLYTCETQAAPFDPSSGKTGATGSPSSYFATEAGLRGDVPVGSVVWLSPHPFGNGYWRFRYAPQGPRLVQLTGGTSGVLDPNPLFPWLSSGTVTLQFRGHAGVSTSTRPTWMSDGDLVVGLPTTTPGTYDVAVPYDVANERVTGFITTDRQFINGGRPFSAARVITSGALDLGLETPEFSQVNNAAAGVSALETRQVGSTQIAAGPTVRMKPDVTTLSAAGGLTLTNPAIFSTVGPGSLSPGVTYPILDGATGTVSLLGRPDETLEIDFAGGLYTGHRTVGSPPALFTGSFIMKQSHFPSPPDYDNVIVNVVDGIVVSMAVV